MGIIAALIAYSLGKHRGIDEACLACEDIVDSRRDMCKHCGHERWEHAEDERMTCPVEPVAAGRVWDL